MLNHHLDYYLLTDTKQKYRAVERRI